MTQALQQNPFEKIVLAIVLAILLWVGTTVQKNAVTLAAQQQQIGHIEGDVDDVKANLQEKANELQNDRYTKSQAASDQRMVEQRLGRLEQWNQNMSERLRVVEMKQRGLAP